MEIDGNSYVADLTGCWFFAIDLITFFLFFVLHLLFFFLCSSVNLQYLVL